MDDEDIADAADAKQLQNTIAFSGLGSTSDEVPRQDFVMDIFKTTGETMGVKLLKRMGWREGQGVGPKIKRKPRLGEDHEMKPESNEESHLFAPDNSKMISFDRKVDRKGLGYTGESKSLNVLVSDSELQAPPFGEPPSNKGPNSFTNGDKAAKAKTKGVGGFGVGILNDDGSDEEDPYAMGPNISYNRTVGGDKKKKKRHDVSKPSSNPLLKSRPVFISKKSNAKKGGTSFRRCHDGRLPLDGFVLLESPDTLATSSIQENEYPPVDIPPNWKSSKSKAKPNQPDNEQIQYRSSAAVAATSKLSPKSRAALLGETALSGKSVFDFLTPNARTRIADATGKDNLPAALGEASAHKSSQPNSLHSLVPLLSSEIAAIALGRGTAGWMPYAEDLSKRSRYRRFLEIRAGFRPNDELPDRVPGFTNDDWVSEMNEFAHAAQIFKPMTGMMANRFTSSSSAPKLASDNFRAEISHDTEGDVPLLHKKTDKPKTPAEEAAAVGMYGPLTRSMATFYPTRLLCKRFNVKPPTHVQSDPGDDMLSGQKAATSKSMPQTKSTASPTKRLELVGKEDMDHLRTSQADFRSPANSSWDPDNDNVPNRSIEGQAEAENPVVDPERNDALEKERPGEAVFRAIFGSDSEDD